MNKAGRNDPCPCGSGKKYKKCCLVSADEAEFQFRRFQKAHAAVIPRLIEFVFQNFEPEILTDAWKDFNDQEEVEEFDPEGPLNVLFMPWFLLNWIVELKPPGTSRYTETTFAEMFLQHERANLTSDEVTLLRGSIRCPYTLCEVVELLPGVGITLFDLLRRTTYEVSEHEASKTLKKGEIIYCATSDIGGFKSNVGTGPYALPPTAKRDVLNLRKWMVEQMGDSLTTVHLFDFEYDIRGLYLHRVRAMLAPPQLANTDGDLMVPQKVHFEIESADKAFHALKSLAKGWSERELMKRAHVENGSIVKAEIEWLGGTREAKKRLGGPVLLGLLKIDNNRLVAEVNSNERARRIRNLIKKRLGDNATYKTTLIEPIESQVQEMWEAAGAGDFGSRNDFASIDTGSGFGVDIGEFPLEDNPHVRAMLQEHARQYWQSWFDLPVPALNDMTPREAAKTEEGRDLLESLLLLYENNAARAALSSTDSHVDFFGPDIGAIRRELGMD